MKLIMPEDFPKKEIFEPSDYDEKKPSAPLQFGLGYTNIWKFLTLALLVTVILYIILVKNK